MKPEMFFGEAPKTCNFPKSCRVQGAMVEVVEFKSNTLVFKLFPNRQMCRKNLSSIFSFIFRYRLRIINLFYVKLLMLPLEPIYHTRFHSSHVLNWQLEEAVINEFED